VDKNTRTLLMIIYRAFMMIAKGLGKYLDILKEEKRDK